jgi:hypothetical protein
VDEGQAVVGCPSLCCKQREYCECASC